MTLTVKDYDVVQKAATRARSLAADISAMKNLLKGSPMLSFDPQAVAEIEAALTGAADREKLRVVTTINTAMGVVAP